MWGQEDEQDFMTDLKVASVNCKETDGKLKFEFLKHFLTRCEHKGKNIFVEKKKGYIDQRRAARKAGDESAYAKIVVGMIQEEEKNMNEIIQAALKQLNIEMQTFGMTMMASQQDQTKGKQIMEIQQQVLDIPEEELLDEKTCLEVFAKQHAIMMGDVASKGEEIAKGMQPPKSKEEHRERIERQMIAQAKDADQLFEITGVEVDVLDASIESLDLTKNPEFEAMAKEGGQKMHEAVEAAMKKFNIQPPNGMGGGMPQMPGQETQGNGPKRSSSPYKQRRF